MARLTWIQAEAEGMTIRPDFDALSRSLGVRGHGRKCGGVVVRVAVQRFFRARLSRENLQTGATADAPRGDAHGNFATAVWPGR